MYIKHIACSFFFLFCLLIYGCASQTETRAVLPAITSLASPTTASRSGESISISSPATLTGSIPISIQLGIAVDQTFAYWVDKRDMTVVKRVHLAAPHQVEIIATSSYTNGAVSDPAISFNNRWLVYLDSPTWYISSEWKFIVLDLTTHTTKVALEGSGAPYETQPIPSPELAWFSLSENELLLAYALLPAADGCQRFVTRLVNLIDLHTRVLQETNCTASAEVWLSPQIDQNYLVAELDKPVSAGSGTNIIINALKTGAITVLTQDGINAEPYLSNDYVVWKRAHRSDFGLSAGVYNRRTQEIKTITLPAKFSRIMVSEHWLYWTPDTLQSLYIYDLDRDQFIQVADSQHCSFFFADVAMRGSILVWVRQGANPRDFFLEWRSVDHLLPGPFTLCDPPKA